MKEGISVIIATYNRQDYIAEAIQSVIAQHYDGTIEIIISDDGSTDKTLEICESFKKNTKADIKILKKPVYCHQQGVSSTRNRGLRKSTQQLISFLDSDDFLLPGHFNKIVTTLEKSPELGFAFCRMLELREQNNQKMYRPWTHQRIFKSDIRNPVISRGNVYHTNSLVFRRIVFEKVGFFNESYSNAEDSDQWIRISEHFRGIFSNHYGAVYRTEHGKNQLTKNSGERIILNHLSVHKKALQRSYELGLMDSDRIFELKHLILHGKYTNNKFLYFFKYLNLISQYPISFLKRIPKSYFHVQDKIRRRKWVELTEL